MRGIELVNGTAAEAHSPRLSDVLFHHNERSFATLAALPSNVQALEAGLLFSAGLNTLVSIAGPSGWGKTHLLEAVCWRLARERDLRCQVIDSISYVGNPSRYDPSLPLILDDVQELFGKPKLRTQLRYVLERRVKSGKPTLLAFTAPTVNRQIRAFLPANREWTMACMGAPHAAERLLVLEQMCSQERLLLSPKLMKVIATHMHGNGRTLSGALKRLRLSGDSWTDPKRTLSACGLLEPFFADNGNWDLKHVILKAAECSAHRYEGLNMSDLSLHVMLNIACLSESSVARVTSISPAEVYLRASKFAKSLDNCEKSRLAVREFTELVLDSIGHN